MSYSFLAVGKQKGDGTIELYPEPMVTQVPQAGEVLRQEVTTYEYRVFRTTAPDLFVTEQVNRIYEEMEADIDATNAAFLVGTGRV